MLRPSGAEQLISLIGRCGLPVDLPFNSSEITETMRKDKKRAGDEISFILLEEIGKAVIKRIRLNDLKNILDDLR